MTQDEHWQCVCTGRLPIILQVVVVMEEKGGGAIKMIYIRKTMKAPWGTNEDAYRHHQNTFGQFLDWLAHSHVYQLPQKVPLSMLSFCEDQYVCLPDP